MDTQRIGRMKGCIAMTLGERIHKFRLQRGWTLRVLAKLSRVDHAWISRVETGERSNISLEAAMRVAQALGVSLDYLAGLTFDPTPRPRRPRLVDGQEVTNDHAAVLRGETS